MHAHTAERLKIRGCWCQGIWPAAAEILIDSTDLSSTTESLTAVVLDCDEETLKILHKIYGYTQNNMHLSP